MYLLAETALGRAAGIVADTAQTYPVLSTITAVLLGIAGFLKTVGIGPTQYKEYGGKLIAWLLTVLPIPAVLKPIAKLTAEQLLDMLIDALNKEGVPEEEILQDVLAIAPKIQKARLARFTAAAQAKCETAKGSPSPTLANAEAL